MRVEIDSNGKITVFDEQNNVVRGIINGTVRFEHDGPTVVEVEAYMMVDGEIVTSRGNT